MKEKMALRPYQQEAVAAVEREWEQGRRRTLLVLPTGCGKTVVFCRLAENAVRRGERVLILAHRGELLDQAAEKLQKFTGLSCAREQAEEHAASTFFRVTVASIQTLQQESRLAAYAPGDFDVIVVDEAHHCLSDSYRRVLDYFGGARVLGVTATPDRGDRKDLSEIYASIAYEYRLFDAIRDGYLCRISAQTIPLSIDLSGVAVRTGDFAAEDVGHALEPYLDSIADEMAAVCRGRHTVVFLPLVATSQKFCTLLKERGFRAEEVNGESRDRAEVLSRFAAGEIDVLCNAMLLTEGWDCPIVDCVVVLRPTKVRSLYCQMVGRGTRLASGKEGLLLLDFLWHTARHELCRPAYLVAQTPEVARRMAERLEEAPGTAEDLEALMAAAAADVIAQREETLAKELASMRHRKRALVDPLQYAMSIAAEDLADYVPSFGWEAAPASEKQLAALESAGLFPDAVANAGMAALLLDRLAARRQSGLASPKQIRLLEKYGFRRVGTWKMVDASAMIARIAGAAWRVPRGVVPAEFVPE